MDTAPPTNRQAALRPPEPTAAPGHGPAHQRARDLPHKPVCRHQTRDPQGPPARDPGTQLHPPVGRHQPQNPLGSGPALQ